MIYTPHAAINRRAAGKGRKPRPAGENADRDDLSICVKSGANRAPIGHETPCFGRRRTARDASNFLFSRRISQPGKHRP
ncbi:MAG TPA: hypothetical protein VN699_17225, partial [Pirellulales bacterium]|nr:hypothetical protein [Pirellulales bacterium]